MASHRQSNLDFPNCGESIERLSVTTLTHMELDVLNMLDESIGYIETKESDKPKVGKTFEGKREHLECNDVFQTSETKTVGPLKESIPCRLNAGYVIFDGAEMTYVLKDECIDKLPEPMPEHECNSQSRGSSLTHVSDLPSYLNISHVDLLGRNHLNSTTSRVSLTPYKRLPQYAHFSFVQKFYLFAIGVTPTLAINAFYMSIAFFLPVLGKQVLSRIGICHNVPFLAAMLSIYCGNKHWVPFLPTVPICLVLMATSVTGIPSLAAAQVAVPVFAIYGIVTLNGLCVGLSQSLTSRIVVLFPGGRSGTLISCGAWFGSLLPVVVQMILVLSLDLNSNHSAELANHSTIFLCALFGVVFVGISIGLVSLIRLCRSGIYELFAGRDCAAHSPKNITLGSVPETTIRRYHNIKWYLFSEFAFSLVSYYVFCLAPIAHKATLESPLSNSTPFWRVYLATVFVALFRCGDVIGRVLAAFCCYGHKPQTKATKFFYLMVSVFRIGFVVAAVFYIYEPYFVYNNLFMMAMYFMLAFTSGFFSVSMASTCQSMIRVQPNDTCPIVSQLFSLSGQMGVTLGIALSFVQFTV